MIKVKVWCDPDDVTELEVDDQADPIAIVRDYCQQQYDSGWSDMVSVYVQAGDRQSKRYTAHVRIEVHFDVVAR